MFVVVLIKALRNLLLPGILKIFLLCLLVYSVCWGALAWALSAIFTYFFGTTDTEGFLMNLLAGSGGMIVAYLFFPLLYPILISFFDTQVADTIEREDYPQLPPATGPFWPTLMNDVTFSLKAIGLNILCLPLYLIPLVNVAVYYCLNGYLLGMQFFRIVAGRRLTGKQAEVLMKKSHTSILLMGIAISFCATVPVLNLAAPMVGLAAMLHLFHALQGTDRQEILPPR